MSNTDINKDNDLCANCGKGEENSKSLKACTACKLVKYCNRECQIAHRPQHKKECKRRAAELHDEKLFKEGKSEDCPICMVRLPSLGTGCVYMQCCGKVICRGCTHAVQSRPISKRSLEPKCPFCRIPAPTSDEEIINRYKKRADLNDPIGLSELGRMYKEGGFGLPPHNYVKALKFYHRAGELGFSRAYYNIGTAYDQGRGVERDEKKALHYYELAAIGGDVRARHNLGCMEVEAGNMDKALRHFMIAVKGGCNDTLETIRKMVTFGLATKDDYTKALKSHQEYLDEIRSDQRDKAAAADINYKYY